MIQFNLHKILKWNKIHSVVMISTSLLSFQFESVLPLSLAAGTSFCYYLYIFRSTLKKYKPFAGYANWVTLIRLFTLLVICLIWTELDQLTLFFILLTAIASDVLDGFIARKLNLCSEFGLYLDMETDAFLVSIISFMLWQSLGLHWVVLVAGFLRYMYAVVLLFFNGGTKKEPKRTYASFIAGFFYLALLLPFAITSELVHSILYFACGLIVISFARSFVFQLSDS